MIRQDQRNHLKSLMDWTVANDQCLSYIQQRPEVQMDMFESTLDSLFRHKVVQEIDCSTFVIMLAHMCGFKDPSGNGYDGYGNSTDIHDHLAHFTDVTACRTGTIITFGPGGTLHCCWVYRGGDDPDPSYHTDPEVCSHGTKAGPKLFRLSGFANEFNEWQYNSIGSL